MATGISANRLELLQIAEAVAREKAIDKAIVLEAMTEAMQKAAKTRYGAQHDIRVQIDEETGETRFTRVRRVVESVEDDNTEIEFKDAQSYRSGIALGEDLVEELPAVAFGRIATQAAKQVVFQKVRDAERARQYEEFKDRAGEIVNGLVRRIEYGNVIVDLGRAEAMLRRDQLIARESFRIGDRVRAYVQSVTREQRGPQILLSRTDVRFMQQLFIQEVPEVYEGAVEIKATARDPGSRAKIAVVSHNSSIDPVGACVGMRGSRVQAVVNELQGEKVDIIPWSPDAATFIVNALAPAEVSKVVLDEDAQKIEVVVPDDQLSLAIGRRGQNVRLASQLTQWDIDIMSEVQESEQRQTEFAQRTKTFMDALDMDEMLAQLLASEGFATVEEVGTVPVSELTDIEGFDATTAEEIQMRAREHIEKQNAAWQETRKKLGVQDDVAALPGLTPAMLAALGEAQLLTVEDLGGCVPDDLRGWMETKNRQRVKHVGALDGFEMSEADAQAIIMAARVKAGWVQQDDLDARAAAAAAAEQAAADAEAGEAGEAGAADESAPDDALAAAPDTDAVADEDEAEDEAKTA